MRTGMARKYERRGGGLRPIEAVNDRGYCQQLGWKGSSGDYPEKDSIRVGSSEGATR